MGQMKKLLDTIFELDELTPSDMEWEYEIWLKEQSDKAAHQEALTTQTNQ